MADFRQINSFRDLLLLLLQRVGSKLEISKLASEIGISRETVYSYLSFLEGTYFIFLLSPFSRNMDREVSGTKKVY
jgi:predicted AAA+ superfamily ATPase